MRRTGPDDEDEDLSLSIDDPAYSGDIVPLRDTFLLDDAKLKRKFFTDAIKQNVVERQSILTEAVHDSDREIAYYAVSLMTAHMEQLNEEFSGELTIAIQMFQGKYHRKFFNQLISSQLDVDRLDYLKRDSFYTGAAEGNINTQRILSMINVCEDELAVDEKGIYSIEHYLVARMSYGLMLIVRSASPLGKSEDTLP